MSLLKKIPGYTYCVNESPEDPLFNTKFKNKLIK